MLYCECIIFFEMEMLSNEAEMTRERDELGDIHTISTPNPLR